MRDMPPKRVETYSMADRARHFDFDLKTEAACSPLQAPHRHAYFQIKLCLAGEYEQYVGGTWRPFRRGYLSFVSPYQIHHTPHPPGARFAMLSFSQAFLFPDLGLDPLDLNNADLIKYPELAPFLFQENLDFSFTEQELAGIEVLVAKMKYEHERRGFASLGLIRGYLLELICSVCNKYARDLLTMARSHGQYRGQMDPMQRLSKFIRTNLAEKITLADAADAAHLSPNYLTHLIKRRTGHTFVDLVTERRMEAAVDLLGNSLLRIDRIAGHCGFRDQAYFTRKFTQKFGMSPRAYRDTIHARRHMDEAASLQP